MIDPELQFALAKGSTVRRQKVINNLPGTSAFCPLVRRTPKLDRYVAAQLPRHDPLHLIQEHFAARLPTVLLK